MRDLAHAVNATKHMIDGTRVALERKKNERMEQGRFFTNLIAVLSYLIIVS